ncbi:MAG: protein-disulfide reductase DsbD [Pasteurellaceae bacterium]|nr:protein-disulfide reductase DsbD [Pasteurellaceae bacterium]
MLILIRIATFLSLLLSLASQASLFNTKPRFLSADEAFMLATQIEDNTLLLNWQIAEGYYLYQKEISFTAHNTTVGNVLFPASERYQDEFFGQVDIFRHTLNLQIPLAITQENAYLDIHYQGCTQGFCYPPQTKTVRLSSQQGGEKNGDFTKNADAVPTLPPQTDQYSLANRLSNNQLSVLWFFILGLGLAFTPCVLPMLPLLSSLVIGSHQRTNHLRAFLLSFTYVQGMAVTYTALGLIVAAIGFPFQIALQSPPVLIGLSVLFVLLSLSMFGFFTIELPHRWQQKLNQLSQRQQGGEYSSVFAMGMIAGLVASPCTSAPLSGALLYVAQSGNLLTGGLALYLLALGMGIPLMLITLFGNQILPKSGNWLLKVKTLFGFVMLTLPIFLISRLTPHYVEELLWSTLSITMLIWLTTQFSAYFYWQKMLKALLFIGIILSGKPWTDLIWPSPTQSNEVLQFERIQHLSDLQQKLSTSQGKKVMLDLYADWCVACKEFEKYTFSDPQVKAELKNMLILQIDMTRNSASNDEMMKQFQILGLPTILFFDEHGNELSHKRITGFMPSTTFIEHLNNL